MTEDDFLSWREHPVTRWVFKGIEAASAAQRDEWLRLSWLGGVANPDVLIELRTRADSLLGLTETSYEQWSQWNEPTDP